MPITSSLQTKPRLASLSFILDIYSLLQKCAETSQIRLHRSPPRHEFVLELTQPYLIKLIIIGMPENMAEPPQFIQELITGGAEQARADAGNIQMHLCKSSRW
jgi:hypothetical protein